MANLIRPEAKAALLRHQQTIMGGAIVALGLWLASLSFGIVLWFAYAVTLVGFVVAIDGLRRARFSKAASGDGPGIVEIDERRISWMSAHFGGAVDMDLLKMVEVQVTAGAKALWIFTQTDGQRLAVPSAAQGAEKLIDALAALKGFDFATALKALEAKKEQRFVLWRAGDLHVEKQV